MQKAKVQIRRVPTPGPRFFVAVFCLLHFAFCIFCSPLAAQETSADEPAAKPPMHLGKVELDQDKRRVTFPAVLNMTEGMLEYVLVGNQGKTHESLLRTEVEPTQVHTAMLLLGVKAGERHPGDAPPAAINADYLRTAPALKGDSVTVFLKWTAGGKEVTCRAEELIFNLQTKATAPVGDWTYNGSMFDQNQFLAQEEKSFIALVTDPTALVNNPRPGHDNDQIWSVAKEKVPAKDTPVQVILELKPAATAASPSPTP